MTLSDRGQPGDFFSAAYGEKAPWDIGEPQPAMLALLDTDAPVGPVLDVGCGTGDLAIAVARRGLQVLGLDLTSAAIEQARARAASLTPEVARLVEFRVGDALRPSLLGRQFGAVVDSGFFHLFGPTERESFARELEATLVDGGRYYLLGFAFDSPLPNAPRQVREDELRTLFSPERGWRALELHAASFVTRSARGPVPAVAACFERALPDSSMLPP
jgi:cyclopropane fatty-acyl-phospholipid synthase-like methyltransferase